MAIQLVACIGMTVGFFVLLGITPSDFTEGVFRQLTSKPRSIRDEINESTQRKKKSILRREVEGNPKYSAYDRAGGKVSCYLRPVSAALSGGAAAAFLLGNFFLSRFWQQA